MKSRENPTCPDYFLAIFHRNYNCGFLLHSFILLRPIYKSYEHFNTNRLLVPKLGIEQESLQILTLQVVITFFVKSHFLLDSLDRLK